jgi:hypothetical protein
MRRKKTRNYRAAAAKLFSSKNIQQSRRVSVKIFTEITSVNLNNCLSDFVFDDVDCVNNV